MAFWKSHTIGYSDLASDFEAATGQPISEQAIAKKMQKAEQFFATLAKGAIENSKVTTSFNAIQVSGVGDIHLADSSTIALRKTLASLLPGTGGNGPKAAVKLHAMFNVSKQAVSYLSLVEGTTSEHVFKDTHIQVTNVGDLIVRDLGFYDAEDLKSIAENGRFFLSRVPLSVKKFTDDSGKIVNLWDKLAGSNRFSFEGFFVVGDDGILTRVVAVRLPKEQWKKRLASLREEKGRSLTKTEKAKAKWNLLITNLSQAQASVEILQKLYALRWQVELLFKAWKSSLAIDRIKLATCKAVIMAFIWARLTYAIFMVTIRGVFESSLKCEIGLIRWYRRLSIHLSRMRDMIFDSKWLQLAKLFRDVIVPYSLPEKTRRKSSLKKANDSIFLDLKRASAFKH